MLVMAPSPGQSRGLRSTITAAIVALALLAILTAGALVVLTTVIHASGSRASAAVEGVRLTEALQHGLVLHPRLEAEDARNQVAEGLRARLSEVRPQLMDADDQA